MTEFLTTLAELLTVWLTVSMTNPQGTAPAAAAAPGGKKTMYVKVDADVHGALEFASKLTGRKMTELINLLLRDGLELDKPVDPIDLLDAARHAAKRKKEQAPEHDRGQPQQPVPSA